MSEPTTQRVSRPCPEESLSVLWVTNLAAPYRRPVWAELSSRHQLTVALLESNNGIIKDKGLNRGNDWQHDSKGGVLYFELPTWKYSRGESRFYTLKSVRAIAAVRKYDVVLFGGWESPAYWMLLLACKFFQTPGVAFYESPQNTMTHKSGPIALLRALFFRCMNRIVVPGSAASDAVAYMGVPRERILQGFNAVDVTAFHAAAASAIPPASEEALNGHRYLFVGQLIRRKRVLDIIESFLQVAEMNDELTIVGTGEQLTELQDFVRGHESQIKFLGQVQNSELPQIMAAHHTLVLASEQEVWGLVVNEALASGMHVVVTDNCGVSRSVGSMEGVYIALESLQDLAEQMQRSRLKWAGRVRMPEILQYTTTRFAEVFDEAFRGAKPTRHSARKGAGTGRL
jgi:glycosyltransferase involved in cell wall biosynthesis